MAQVTRGPVKHSLVDGGEQDPSGSGRSGSSESESESESGSGSESESESDSDSDSGSDRPMVKPVFLSKSKRQPGQSPQEDTDRLKRITLSKAEHSLQVDEKEVKEDQFDGIQDTDDVDPEAEYLEWMQREYQRYQRDRLTLKLEEDEKDALVRRRLNLEVPSVDEPSADGSTFQLDLPVKRPHPPAKPSRPTKLKLKK